MGATMRLSLFSAGFLAFASAVLGQEITTPTAQIYIQNKSFDDSEKARQEILELYDGLRVSDVSDGMDQIGRPDVGVMADTIRPVWRDTEQYRHVICGFALTVRYLPTDKVPPNPHPNGDYAPFQQMWYAELGHSHFGQLIRPGDIIVADANEVDAGFLGSNNAMDWMRKGARGVVTNGGPRDSDEITSLGFPVYSRKINTGTNMGRLETESANRPVNCGGVTVYPGDVIVADGDGVVVVPRELALEAGRIARGIYNSDLDKRARKFREMGLKPDARTKDRR